MSNEEKIGLLEELLDIEQGSLEADTYLEDIDEYTSIAKLSLIVLMEDEFDVSLAAADFREFETVGDILARMGR